MAALSVRKFGGALKAGAFIHRKPVSVTASASLKPAEHAGRTIKVDAAAGLTLTLPTSSGSGNRYRVLIGTTITSNTVVVKVANATDVMVGGILENDIGDSTAATVDFFPTASTSDTITLTASIGAGKKGDWLELEDMASGFWAVHGMVQGVTDPTTPFSATV